MASVTLRIGGRAYDIACRAGEEAHFEALAAAVDGKAAEATAALGGVTETRLLLFAALLLADEAASLRARQEETALQKVSDADAAVAVEALARRVEKLGAALERMGATS